MLILTSNIKKDFTIFNFSGLCYISIEIMWRGYTHYTMFFTGGLCFLILYKIYNKYKNLTFFQKYIIGAISITAIEFFVGCIVNLILNMNVWDYSNMPLSIYGQVCLIYSFLWGFLGVLIEYLVNDRTFKKYKIKSISV